MIEPQSISFRHRGPAGVQRMRRRGAQQRASHPTEETRQSPPFLAARARRRPPRVPLRARNRRRRRGQQVCSAATAGSSVHRTDLLIFFTSPYSLSALVGDQCSPLGAAGACTWISAHRAGSGARVSASSRRVVRRAVCRTLRRPAPRRRARLQPTALRRHVAVAGGRSGSCVRAPSVNKARCSPLVRRSRPPAGRRPRITAALHHICIGAAGPGSAGRWRGRHFPLCAQH
jgi:hypothetical protein